MKKLIFLLFTAFLFGQNLNPKLETFKIYSKNVKDSVEVKVWLPANYDKTKEKYPILFECVYDHTNYLANTTANMWDIPKTIVVWAKIEAGNDNYNGPELTEIGQKYYAFIKDELFQNISKKYRTVDYKTACGLSQGGDYIGYIFRNNPELFNGYMIFSTERPVFYTPKMSSYIEKIQQPLQCYIAVAGKDDSKRIQFADQLTTTLKSSKNADVKQEIYPNAEHSYSILYAFPEALYFIYKDYINYPDRNSNESLTNYYKKLISKREKYGNLNYNSFIYYFSEKIKKTDTEEDLNSIINLMDSDEQSYDIDFFNFGYNAMENNQFISSRKAFNLALQKAEIKENRMDKSSIYRFLARTFDKEGNKKEAISTLENAYLKLKNKDEQLLFDIGKYYITSKLDTKKGIKILENYVTEKYKVLYERSKDEIYIEIAKGYIALNNKKMAQKYLENALEVNPSNEDAINLKKELTK